MQIICRNKKATFNYFIEDRLEAGIVLLGSEVASLRQGKANIDEAYATHIENELYILNMNISEYSKANIQNHAPKRARKLLLHKKQIKKLIGKVKQKGYTIVPISLYFNKKGIAKIEIGIGCGKKLYDKRETIKKRDIKREQSRQKI